MVAKAVNMLLKEERKGEKLKDPEKGSAIVNAALSGNKNGIGRLICKICDRLYDGVCYIERPDLASDWYHEMKGTKRKRDDQDDQSKAMVLIARCF